jgi:hypothetical protein
MDRKRVAGAFEVGGGEDREDAWRRLGCRYVKPDDPTAGDRAPQAADMKVTLRLQVIDELTGAAEEAAVLQPLQAPSDRSGVILVHRRYGRRRDRRRRPVLLAADYAAREPAFPAAPA